MAKVTDYLVDTLKALGAGDLQTGEELDRNAIALKIDLNDSAQIRDSLKIAVGRQLQKDHQGQDVQSHELAYAFNAAKKVLLDNNIFGGMRIKTKKGKILTPEDLCDLTLNKLRLNFDNTTDTLLAGVTAGLAEREGMKEKQAEQLAAVFGDVVLDGYQDFLAQNQLTVENLSPAEYKEIKNQEKIARSMVELLGGDEKRAMAILNQPVTADSAAWHNAALSGEYRKAAATRQARGELATMKGVANDGQVRVLDLLMATSQSVTKAQVLAFCEQRATEQNQVGDQRLERDDPTRLANVLGHEGREAVEQVIDGHLSNKMIPLTNAPKSVSLPKHTWRGYAKLVNHVMETVKDMFGSLQRGAYAERVLSKNKKSVAVSREPKPAGWEIQGYATMPENYRDDQGKLTAAGEFFERVQARLMADKVKLTEYQVKVQADPKDQDANNKLQYYYSRIQAANDALGQVAHETARDADLLKDQDYYQNLDSQILLLDNHPNDQALLANDTVSDIAEQDESRTSEDYWVDALQTFKNHNDQAAGTAENNASYQMLADMFSLGDRYGKDVTQADLANLLQNVPNGPFNPKKVEQFIKGLTAQPNSKGALTAADCRAGMHDAATNFLAKVKYQDAYANYELASTANDQLSHLRNM